MVLRKKHKEQKEEKPENPAYQTITIEVEKDQASMDPKQFMFWGLLGSITLLFTGLLIAHIILWAQGNGYGHSMPIAFYISTAFILGSSYTLFQAQQFMREDHIELLQQKVLLTLILGTLFMISQGFGWYDLLNQYSKASHTGIVFLFILSGLHGLHLLGGLVYLALLWWWSRNYTVHSRNQKPVINCSTYWHFVDGLWLYAFLILWLF